jgi:hypothetical protein
LIAFGQWLLGSFGQSSACLPYGEFAMHCDKCGSQVHWDGEEFYCDCDDEKAEWLPSYLEILEPYKGQEEWKPENTTQTDPPK